MKNIFLLSIAFLLTALSGPAQNPSSLKVELGIEVGPNLSFMYGNSNLPKYLQPAVGFVTGFSLQVNFSNVVSMHTGLSFERKVVKWKDDVVLVDQSGEEGKMGTLRDHYDYLIFPVLIRASFGHKVKFFVNAGGYAGLMLGAERVEILTDTKQTVRSPIKSTEKIDAGLSAGLGVRIPIVKQFAISLEARDNFGLLPVIKENSKSVELNSAAFLVGFSYGFK